MHVYADVSIHIYTYMSNHVCMCEYIYIYVYVYILNIFVSMLSSSSYHASSTDFPDPLSSIVSIVHRSW